MTTIRKSIYLAASPAKVWSFLTKAEHLTKWFNAARSDLMHGQDYTLINPAGEPLCWGTVTEMTPNTRLAMTFTVAPLDGQMTDVVWTLTEVPGGTKLELEHTGLPASEAGFGLVLALDKGWDTHLAGLRQIAA
ncbi:MAG: SRPBCC domain-containing protein [Pseudomonadota bacterium]